MGKLLLFPSSAKHYHADYLWIYDFGCYITLPALCFLSWTGMFPVHALFSSVRSPDVVPPLTLTFIPVHVSRDFEGIYEYIQSSPGLSNLFWMQMQWTVSIPDAFMLNTISSGLACMMEWRKESTGTCSQQSEPVFEMSLTLIAKKVRMTNLQQVKEAWKLEH